MKTIKKNKIYKELLLVWPNVDRMVNEAEQYLDDLVVPGSDMPFVENCALLAAKKARDLEYTQGYTLKKLLVFCDEFKACLLGLENIKVSHQAHEWNPDEGPFKEFLQEEENYDIGKRDKPATHTKFRKMVDKWVEDHV